MSTLKPLLFIFTVVFLSKCCNPLLRKSGFPISESFDKYSPELTFTMRQINEKEEIAQSENILSVKPFIKGFIDACPLHKIFHL